MKDLKIYQWGILGAARVNQKLLPAIQQNKNSIIKSIASRRDGAAQSCIDEYLSNHKSVACFNDFDKVILDDEIDIIYIPLANEEHFEPAMKAIQANKHVLIEKPMALKSAEVNEIITEAKKNHVIVMEGFMYAFHPQFARIKEIIQSGQIGSVKYAHAMFSFPIQPARFYRINRSINHGGGALWDIGPYAVHTLRQMLNAEPTEVIANAELNTHGADMSTSGLLNFNNGLRATFDISFECTRRSEFEVFGDKGRIKCHTVWQHENDEAVISFLEEGKPEKIEHIAKANHFDLEINHFIDCVEKQKYSPTLSPEDAIGNAKTLEALSLSIKKNSWVKI